MAVVRCTNRNGMDTVVLSGEVTIELAGSLMAALQQALELSDQVILDTDGMTGMSLAGLQLLCSAHRTALGLNKHILWKSSWPKALAQAIQDNGYSRHTGCSLDRSCSCLWVKGEN